MAITLVRQTSDTPNINNTDDARALRYAFGNYNGYVKDYGLECDIDSSNTSIIKIQSGELVLQGWQVKIDGTGVSVAVAGIPTAYYTIYLEVNLTTQVASIKSIYDTSNYPSVELGDDLTTTNTGTARLPIYHVKATSGHWTEATKLITYIPYLNEVKEETITTSKEYTDSYFIGANEITELRFEESGKLRGYISMGNYYWTFDPIYSHLIPFYDSKINIGSQSKKIGTVWSSETITTYASIDYINGMYIKNRTLATKDEVPYLDSNSSIYTFIDNECYMIIPTSSDMSFTIKTTDTTKNYTYSKKFIGCSFAKFYKGYLYSTSKIFLLNPASQSNASDTDSYTYELASGSIKVYKL